MNNNNTKLTNCTKLHTEISVSQKILNYNKFIVQNANPLEHK